MVWMCRLVCIFSVFTWKEIQVFLLWCPWCAKPWKIWKGTKIPLFKSNHLMNSLVMCQPFVLYYVVYQWMVYLLDTWVKVFRIIPEFRILRLTFHRKSASKCWIRRIIMAFSDLFSVHLRKMDHFTWNY